MEQNWATIDKYGANNQGMIGKYRAKMGTNGKYGAYGAKLDNISKYGTKPGNYRRVQIKTRQSTIGKYGTKRSNEW
jgi:hypothetical protein